MDPPAAYLMARFYLMPVIALVTELTSVSVVAMARDVMATVDRMVANCMSGNISLVLALISLGMPNTPNDATSITILALLLVVGHGHDQLDSVPGGGVAAALLPRAAQVDQQLLLQATPILLQAAEMLSKTSIYHLAIG